MVQEGINSLVEEKADILKNQQVTREEEADILKRTLADIEKGNVFWLVAEVDGEVIANSDLRPRQGYSSHVGEIGMVVKRNYRDIGIGMELLKGLISQAKTLGLAILTLSVFASNKRAIHIYEKAGFTEIGRVPHGFLKDGQYIDEIIMVKELNKSD